MAAELENTTTLNHSPSNSQDSSTLPSSPPNTIPLNEEAAEEGLTGTGMDPTGASAFPDNNNNNTNLSDNSLQCFTAEEIAKYDKYEADFASYLRAKYFSDKDIYGGNIFDVSVKVGDETIKASRWSPTRSYADPSQSFAGPNNTMESGEDIPCGSGVKTSQKFPNGSATLVKKSN